MHPTYRSIPRPVAQGIEGTCPSVRKRPHVPEDNRLRAVDGCPVGGLVLDDLCLHPIAYARRFRGVQPRLLGGADLADFALLRLTGRRHTILPRSRRARAEGPIPDGVLLSLLCAEPFCWSFDCRSRRGRRLLVAPAPFTGSLVATADRRLVGTSIAAVSEEASGILSGDAVESGSERLLQCLNSARGDPAEVGFHLGPSGFDRAEVRTVGRQIAIGKA